MSVGRLFYNLIFILLIPAILLRMLLRSRKAPEYRKRWAERFGFHHIPEQFHNGIWIHAVSLGETIAAQGLIENLLEQDPKRPIVLTNMTPTGSAESQKRFGDRVYNGYLPYDLPWLLTPFIRQFSPKKLVIIETEMWPNLIHQSKKNGVEVILANARLSEKSANGYKKIAGLTRSMLSALDKVAVQNTADGQRFIELGLDNSKLTVTGSVKYDVQLDSETIQKAQLYRTHWQDKKVLIAASTHNGEDELLLKAFGQLRNSINNLIMIIAPRHPERFNQVVELVKGMGYQTSRRSDDELSNVEDVLVIDSLGELNEFYGASDVAFVGGSLIAHGGHNPIEPALWGMPIVMGESFFNFKDICEQLVAENGIIISPENSLVNNILTTFEDQNREFLGLNSKRVVERNRGALSKLLKLVLDDDMKA